jgi:zinc/manganese transport system substrate-binding protein
MKFCSKSIGFAMALTLSPLSLAAEKLNVIASFSILGDITQQLGGDKIKLTTLVGSNADSHTYRPTPYDAKKLASADVLVLNGLGFEGWIPRLEESSGFKGVRVIASNGADIINTEDHEKQDDHEKHDDHDKDDDHEKHDDHEEHAEHEGHHHGGQDPHAWHSLANIRIYVNNISDALILKDPANSAYYEANIARYIDKIELLQKELDAQVKTLAADARQVITSHDAFGYIERDYNLSFYAPVGFSTQSQPSAADVATLIKQIKEHNIKALFVENVSDDRLIKQIGRESKVKIGGKLYSDALSAKDGPANTYLKMMKHNISTLVNALH